jgi:streptomycin 6-kinase
VERPVLPAAVLAFADRGPEWATWVDGLAGRLGDVLEEWQLTPDGPAGHGHTALVLPVRTSSGRPAVLKLTWPHAEAEHEHLALQRWHGDGAVQLLRADPARWAMLLERLHPEDLTDLWDLDACEIVGGLYARLHVPASPQLRLLSSFVRRWTADLADLPSAAPIPRRLVEQAVSLGRAFLDDPATDGTLIHGDLHYENVLAADREPWLAIDPKPVSGDPHYEVAPLLWNRWDDVTASHRIRDALQRRFWTVVEAGGLDGDRARDWVVVRQVHLAMWAFEGEDGMTEDAARDMITRSITIAKAVQG